MIFPKFFHDFPHKKHHDLNRPTFRTVEVVVVVVVDVTVLVEVVVVDSAETGEKTRPSESWNCG